MKEIEVDGDITLLCKKHNLKTNTIYGCLAVAALLLLSQPLQASVLLKATHHTRLTLASGTQAASIWIPLPMNYETQVPLSFTLSVTPENLQHSAEFSVDTLGNAGVLIQFSPGTSAPEAALHTEALVLTHDQIQGDRSEFYPDVDNVSEWLTPAPSVDSNHLGIQQFALDLARQSSSAMDFFIRIQAWFKREFSYGLAFPYRLDSIGAFETKKTTCTGFANLTAALGRAVRIPTRTLAGYLVGIPQQTHSINEYYIGSGWGWWRVEPQIQTPSLPEEYLFLVRVNRTQDEGLESFQEMRPGNIPRGVPMRSLVELSGQVDRIRILPSAYFSGYPNYDNEAHIVRLISEDAFIAKELFFRARQLWNRDLNLLVGQGHFPSNIRLIRESFYAVRNLTELGQAIGRLEQALKETKHRYFKNPRETSGHY